MSNDNKKTNGALEAFGVICETMAKRGFAVDAAYVLDEGGHLTVRDPKKLSTAVLHCLTLSPVSEVRVGPIKKHRNPKGSFVRCKEKFYLNTLIRRMNHLNARIASNPVLKPNYDKAELASLHWAVSKLEAQ